MTRINETLLHAYMALAGLKARLSEERGQDLLEYALLGGLIAAAILAASVAATMTGGLEAMATGIKNCIDFNTSTACG